MMIRKLYLDDLCIHLIQGFTAVNNSILTCWTGIFKVESSCSYVDIAKIANNEKPPFTDFVFLIVRLLSIGS